MITTTTARTRSDGVVIVRKMSTIYKEKTTGAYYHEVPDGHTAAEYWNITGRLQQDQTGKIFKEQVYDVEGSEFTYTELLPSQELANPPAWLVPSVSGGYAEGDLVNHDSKTWISDMDENIYEPGVYGWTLYSPFVDDVDVYAEEQS